MRSFFGTNSLGTANVARLAETYGTRVIYSSSVAVYELSARTRGLFTEDEELPGNGKTVTWKRLAVEFYSQIAEEWAKGKARNLANRTVDFLRRHPPPDNEGVYGLSKFIGEHWIAQLPQGVVLRLSDVYGPGHGSRGILQNCLWNLVHSGDVNRSIDFGTRGLVSFVYMGDVLQAILRTANAQRLSDPGIINVANPDAVDEKTLTTLLLQLGIQPGLGTHISAKRDRHPLDARFFATDRMEQNLGILSTTLREGIIETLRYLQLSPGQKRRYTFPHVHL